MQRRSYVALAATVTGLAIGGLVLAITTAARTPDAVIVGIGSGVIGALIGGFVGRQEHVKRWKKLRLLAGVRRQLGFRYRRKVPAKELEPFRSLELFKVNRYTAATDWMQGMRQGESVLVFDFEVHGGSQATRTSGQAVVLFPESAHGLPQFHLRPRALLRDFLGDDVSFDPAVVPEGERRQALERFAKAYVVQSPDEAGVRQVFTAGALRFLADKQGWNVQCDGQHLLLFRPGKTELKERPAQVDEALGIRAVLAEGVVESIPSHSPASPMPIPTVVPGKQRGRAYRAAQLVWRIVGGLTGAAFLGAMAGLQLGRRGNPLIAARNGALIGMAFITAVTLVAFLALVGRMLLKRRSEGSVSEQKESP
jgi:hypothetical protein